MRQQEDILSDTFLLFFRNVEIFVIKTMTGINNHHAKKVWCIDPLGQPIVTAGRDRCFTHVVRPSVPTFQI